MSMIMLRINIQVAKKTRSTEKKSKLFEQLMNVFSLLIGLNVSQEPFMHMLLRNYQACRNRSYQT